MKRPGSNSSNDVLSERPSPQQVVARLSDAACYSERPRQVTLCETHISWVFLTERYAYKLKKPVRFDFLDYSTPEARRRACEEEVRLNRRLARQVYLGVEPITLDGRGQPQLGGAGPIVDWVVKMRRLPAASMLDQLILHRRLEAADIERLAAVLVRFYSEAAPLLLRGSDYQDRMLSHVLANRRELTQARHELPAGVVERVHTAQLLLLRCRGSWLAERVCDGRMVEGHGDLRPEHICLAGEPVVFDCLEFNAELRTVDVLDELSFLAMECDLLGAGWVGQAVLNRYASATNDRSPEALGLFYRGYRACVRAKVAALRADQISDVNGGRPEHAAAQHQAARYLALADEYARRAGPPWLLLVGGLMGTGKSTLATALAEQLGCTCLSTDRLRRARQGPSPAPAGFGTGPYSPAARQEVYQALTSETERLLREQRTVVVDATLGQAADRGALLAAAQHCGARALSIECQVPRSVALSRIAQRAQQGADASEARPDLYDAQAAEFQSFAAETGSLRVDGQRALDEQLPAIWLRMATAD